MGYTNPTANNAVIEFKLDILKDASKKDVLMDADDQVLIVGNYEKNTILLKKTYLTIYLIIKKLP